jgi:membrane protease YdiL (CAAX protease family)
MNTYSTIAQSWITRVVFGIILCIFGIIMDITFLHLEWMPMTLMILILGMSAAEELRGGSFATLGFKIDTFMSIECLTGILLGIIPIVLLILVYRLNHWISMDWNTEFLSISMLPIISLSIIEELIFRGIIFQALVERFGIMIIALLFAGLFSMAHLANPHFDPISMLNTFLASLIFSYAWYHTRGLWLPILLHVSWNIMLFLTGMTLSGKSMSNSLFTNTISPHIPMPWLNSQYGIEGTIYCTLMLLLFIPIIHMLPQSPLRMADYFKLKYSISNEISKGEVYED